MEGAPLLLLKVESLLMRTAKVCRHARFIWSEILLQIGRNFARVDVRENLLEGSRGSTRQSYIDREIF